GAPPRGGAGRGGGGGGGGGGRRRPRGRRRRAGRPAGAGLLLAEMLLFFIPALMSLLDYGALLRSEGWRILLVIMLSTLLVMLVTAVSVEWMCRWRARHESR
ncbi:CidA/LrgA family protein, partial [Pseudomonas aeruginosa]|uniref:CidA/LrgA family protein n=1 Tax=Pseudomonas aeruginosa TaxID=287 RepID=UPI0021F1B0F7